MIKGKIGAVRVGERMGAIPRRSVRAAFSLLDLLVSLAIIAILMAIMLPSLVKAKSTAQQVVCASNVRQIGLCLMMYQDDYKGRMPESRYEPGKMPGQSLADRMVILRDAGNVHDWDGLGHLFESGYMTAPKVFYCPAHTAEFKYSRYAGHFAGEPGEIVGNYQYRGAAAANANSLDSALIVDSIRTKREFNHRVGTNALRNDFSVMWVRDRDQTLARLLPVAEDELEAAQRIEALWEAIDEAATSTEKK